MRHPFAFIDFVCFSKIQFHQSGPFKLIETMLKSLNVSLGLSTVWSRYSNGSQTKGVYDEIKDRSCKEYVTEYHLVY